MSGEVTTCSKCHRAVYVEHVDGEGRCVNCVTPAHGTAAARPAASHVAAPPLVNKKEGE